MKVETAPVAPDTYLDLVRAFPLRRLRTDEEHDQALLIAASFSRPGSTDDQVVMDYLDVLIDLIGDYEEKNGLKIDTSGVTAADMVLHLLEAREMTVNALAQEVSVPADELNAMLAGDRAWSPVAVSGIAGYLNIHPELFQPHRRD